MNLSRPCDQAPALRQRGQAGNRIDRLCPNSIEARQPNLIGGASPGQRGRGYDNETEAQA